MESDVNGTVQWVTVDGRARVGWQLAASPSVIVGIDRGAGHHGGWVRIGTGRRRGDAHSDTGTIRHVGTESCSATGTLSGLGLPGAAKPST